MAIAMEMVARQAAVTTHAAASSFNYNQCTYNAGVYSQFDNCIISLEQSGYPTCYNFYSDKGCCQRWLSYEYSYYSCAQIAYSTCFNYLGYESSVASYFPCYTDSPLTTPNSVPAQTTRSVPSLVLETISYGPPTTTPSHSSIPTYTGSGQLLQGYCNTPNYILLDGPTAYWAPILGCNNDRDDCCPYSVAKQTDTAAASGTTVTVISTVTVDVGPGAASATYTGLNAYPVAVSADQATLQRCPDDYQTVSGGCCPSGYQLWNAVLGGQVPCYSSLSNVLSPPAVPVADYQTPISIPLTATKKPTSSFSTPSYGSGKPTSAVVNVVYAIQYPLAPQGLTTGAKAGIGAGAGVGGLAIIFLALALIWRTRKHKKDKKAFAAAQAAGQGSTAGLGATAGQAQSMTATSPGQSVQTPASFVPGNGYFPPPQMQQTQQGYPSQNFYGQPTGPHMQQSQGQFQSQGRYPSPPPSSVSPPPPSDGGYSHQGSYPPPGSTSGYAPSSTESQGAAPQAYGYPPTYPPTEITRRPVGAPSTSPTVSSQTTGQGYGYPVPAEIGIPGQQVQQHEQIEHGQRQELHDQSQPRELGS